MFLVFFFFAYKYDPAMNFMTIKIAPVAVLIIVEASEHKEHPVQLACLRVIHCHHVNRDIDAELLRLCPACPALQTLSVQFCTRLTDAGVALSVEEF